MTTMEREARTPEGIADAVADLAPMIVGRAAEIEAARRVPADVLDQLLGTGCFGMSRPVSHGGAGADLPSTMRMLETLASADASVAWIVMIGGCAWVDLASLPRSTFDDLFPRGADVIVAGAFNPTGSIKADDGGYRVSGRWSFASGCEHADVLYGNCFAGIVDGAPQMRAAVFSPSQVVIEDTWTVSGLRGTGSHHIHVDDVLVPADHTFTPLVDEPCLDEPTVRIPVPALIALVVASVAIGAARGAVDDIIAIAEHKVPLLAGAPLATNPAFQMDLATADTELLAARALLYETAELAWSTATDGAPFTLEQRARVRAAAVWASERAAAVIDTAYRAGGGSSIYADCPLQRRLRDIHALTQHFIVRHDTLITAGAILAGQDVTLTVF